MTVGGIAATTPMEIHYTGMLRSVASWAKVGRELIQALLARGHRITARELVEDRYDPLLELPPEIEMALMAPGPRARHFTFSSPTDYRRNGIDPLCLGFLVFEGSRWPPTWVREASRLARVVVPSSFCRRTLAASGLPIDRIGIVPHGVNPRWFHSRCRCPAGSRPRIRLLFVGTPARRKGLDLLLDAFSRCFVPDDPIDLTIKTNAYRDENQRHYICGVWRSRIADLRRYGFRIDVIEDTLSESEMGDLYRRADLLCQPFRSEGFGMPLLEAMACGTAVLATAWSGPADFLNETVGFPVRRCRPIRGERLLAGYPETAPPTWLVEPWRNDLDRTLRRAVKQRGDLTARGEAAAVRATAWTWEAVADELLRNLASVPISTANSQKEGRLRGLVH